MLASHQKIQVEFKPYSFNCATDELGNLDPRTVSCADVLPTESVQAAVQPTPKKCLLEKKFGEVLLPSGKIPSDKTGSSSTKSKRCSAPVEFLF